MRIAIGIASFVSALLLAAGLSGCAGPERTDSGALPHVESATANGPAPANASILLRIEIRQRDAATVAVSARDEDGTDRQIAPIHSATCVRHVCEFTMPGASGTETFTVRVFKETGTAGTPAAEARFVQQLAPGRNTAIDLVVPGAASRIGSLKILLPYADLPLGQQMNANIVARNLQGKIIVGAFDKPIAVSGIHLAFSSTSLANSTDASHLELQWQLGFAGPAGAVLAVNADGHNAKASVTPATGFAYYGVGTNPNTDVTGFEMVLGPDGNVYYGTLGPLVCKKQSCVANDGAVGKFNPSTHVATEVELHSEAVGLSFSRDKALWIAGGISGNIFRMQPGQFGSRGLQKIPVAPAKGSYEMRTSAEDSSGNMWFTDGSGGRLAKIATSGPYTSSGMTYVSLPPGPSGTPQQSAFGNGTAAGKAGTLYVADYNNGVVDVVNTANGAVTKQLLLPQQSVMGAADTVRPRFIATNGLGTAFLTLLGGLSSGYLSHGSADSLRFQSSAISALNLPSMPGGTLPDSISAHGNTVYYADLYEALGYVNASSGESRVYPVLQSSESDLSRSPAGVAAMPDGTAWYSCNNSTPVFQPLCLGHTVYLKTWTVFPGRDLVIYPDYGPQPIGLMEAPSANSGPFQASANNRNCSVSQIVGHNFQITGNTVGSTCAIRIRDAHGRTALVHVDVSSPPSGSALRARPMDRRNY